MHSQVEQHDPAAVGLGGEVPCHDAVAHGAQSRLRWILLDRFDCPDQPGRGDLLGLLNTPAADGELDTALVLGTLKSAPPAPTDLFTSHWIDHDTNAQPALRAAA